MRNLPQRVGKSAEAIWRTEVTDSLYRLQLVESSTLASPISAAALFQSGADPVPPDQEQSAPWDDGENQILPTVPAIDLGRRKDCAAIPQEPTPKEQEKSRNQAGSHCGGAFDACKIDCSDGEQPRESQDNPDSLMVPLCPGWAARAARKGGHGSLRSGYRMQKGRPKAAALFISWFEARSRKAK